MFLAPVQSSSRGGPADSAAGRAARRSPSNRLVDEEALPEEGSPRSTEDGPGSGPSVRDAVAAVDGVGERNEDIGVEVDADGSTLLWHREEEELNRAILMSLTTQPRAAVVPSEKAVEELTEMGFSKDLIESALRDCDNDVSSALNMLLSMP